MPVNLSIKNVPDELVQRLRERAAQNHRSLQDELMAVLELSVEVQAALTPAEALEQVRKLGLHTGTEAAAVIRDERDKR